MRPLLLLPLGAVAEPLEPELELVIAAVALTVDSEWAQLEAVLAGAVLALEVTFAAMMIQTQVKKAVAVDLLELGVSEKVLERLVVQPDPAVAPAAVKLVALWGQHPRAKPGLGVEQVLLVSFEPMQVLG